MKTVVNLVGTLQICIKDLEGRNFAFPINVCLPDGAVNVGDRPVAVVPISDPLPMLKDFRVKLTIKKFFIPFVVTIVGSMTFTGEARLYVNL